MLSPCVCTCSCSGGALVREGKNVCRPEEDTNAENEITALTVEAGHLSPTQSPIGLASLANQFPLGMHLHLELQAGGGGVWVFTCILGDTNSQART